MKIIRLSINAVIVGITLHGYQTFNITTGFISEKRRSF